MRVKRIVVVPTLSWKVRLATFAGIFGIIWLFVDPLLAFGTGSVILPSLGIWGYICLVIISLFLTLLVEYLNKIRVTGRMIFVCLTIVLTQDGTRHLVEVPRDMLVGNFVRLVLQEFSQHADPKSPLGRHEMYVVSLLVERSNELEEIPAGKTIKQAGLRNGDVCRLFGKIVQREVNFI